MRPLNHIVLIFTEPNSRRCLCNFRDRESGADTLMLVDMPSIQPMDLVAAERRRTLDLEVLPEETQLALERIPSTFRSINFVPSAEPTPLRARQ